MRACFPNNTAHRGKVNTKVLGNYLITVLSGPVGRDDRRIPFIMPRGNHRQRRGRSTTLGFGYADFFWRLIQLGLHPLDEPAISEIDLPIKATLDTRRVYTVHYKFPITPSGHRTLVTKLCQQAIRIQLRRSLLPSHHGIETTPVPLSRFFNHA